MKLVRIPRDLLHVGLGDLHQLGVSDRARDALRALLADLPLVPDASLSALLVGPARLTLPCLAVLARHVGQGLRDYNLSLAHDRTRLSDQRRKLIFLEAAALEETLEAANQHPRREAVVFVVDTTPIVLDLLAERDTRGLASFVTSTTPLAGLAHWRQVDLNHWGVWC
jgi:hypothetical protein